MNENYRNFGENYSSGTDTNRHWLALFSHRVAPAGLLCRPTVCLAEVIQLRKEWYISSITENGPRTRVYQTLSFGKIGEYLSSKRLTWHFCTMIFLFVILLQYVMRPVEILYSYGSPCCSSAASSVLPLVGKISTASGQQQQGLKASFHPLQIIMLLLTEPTQQSWTDPAWATAGVQGPPWRLGVNEN